MTMADFQVRSQHPRTDHCVEQDFELSPSAQQRPQVHELSPEDFLGVNNSIDEQSRLSHKLDLIVLLFSCPNQFCLSISVLGNLIRGSLGNTPRQSPTASPMGSPLIGMAQSRRTAPNSPAGSPLASARPSRAEMESSTLHGSLSGSPLAGVDRDPPTTSLPFARGGATANRRSSTSAIKFY